MNKTFKLYPEKPAHTQIVEELIEQIENGYLLPGDKLNDIAQLQQMFSVSKGTMLKVIKILTTLGFVHTIERQGIYICAKRPKYQDCTDKLTFAEYSFTHFRSQKRTPLFRYTPEAKPALSGSPCINAKLNEAFIRYYHHAYDSGADTSLDSTVASLAKSLIKDLSRQHGIKVDESQICFIKGEHEALKSVLNLLQPSEGQYVVARSANEPRLLNLLFNCGVKILKIEAETWELFAEEVHKVCINYSVKAVYVESRSDNVYGDSLPPQVGQRLLNMASHYRFAIVEIDYNKEDSSGDFLPLIAFNRRNVIYISSLSETLPALSALKFVIASPDVISSLKNYTFSASTSEVLYLQAIDLLYQSGRVTQAAYQARIHARQTREVLEPVCNEYGKNMLCFSNAGSKILLRVSNKVQLDILREILEPIRSLTHEIATIREKGASVKIVTISYKSIAPHQASEMAKTLAKVIQNLNDFAHGR